MAQITSGFRSIFSNASTYNIAQRLIGAEKARRILVRNYIPQQPAIRILDIGCGTAEILHHLPEQIDYFGFDASEAYIAQARKTFGKRGIFRAEQVRQATLDDLCSFDIVLAFGLLHHLDDDEAGTLFKIASNALAPSGKLLTIDPVYTPQQNSLSRWIISKDRGLCIRNEQAYTGLAKPHFDHVTATLRHDMLYIPYSHLILECKNNDIQIL